MRAVFAFLALLSVIVTVPGPPTADAASDELSITTSVDNSAISHGSVSNWTLTIDTAAGVTLASGIVVTDTLPDGLCPLGAGDADCAGGPSPNPAYASATENADGTWTLVWNLPAMNGAEQTVITYSTQTRTYYQEAFADDTPVLARDSWINTATVTGDVDGTPVSDGSTASQSAGGVSVAADAATRPVTLTQPDVCSDGATMTWNPTQAAGYRVGDQVCWRLSVDYPVNLTTHGSVVGDAFPTGQAFTANDTWAPGAGNTVPLADIDGSTNTAGSSSLTWDVGDTGGYVASGRRFEVVFSTTIVNPNATWSGQAVSSVMNHSHLTTAGGSIGASDTAGITVLEPELRLFKGVTEVNGVSTGGSPNVDGVEANEADVVTYQLSVVNNGDVDASGIEMWDLLPARFSPCTTNVGSIDGGGACVDGPNRIEWTGASTLSVSAGATTTVSYDATVPAGISPAVTLTNEAGIVGFLSATNNGSGTFAYVPASNIDGSATGENTAAAEDSSWVVTSAASIDGSRTTSVAEVGNHADSQAAIGELITYTITVIVPEGTTVYDAALVDDLPANLDLISSSHTFSGEQAVVRSDDDVADSVTVEFPDPSYRNAAGTGDDELTVTIVARVRNDVANTRGTSISNSAVFTWHDDQAAASDLTLSRSTTVVEPLMSVSKSSVDSIGDNGIVVGNETVDYTIVVANSGSSSVSTAHDVAVVDTLPEGVTPSLPIPDGGVWAPDATPGDGIGGTITWGITAMDAGSSTVRTYEVTVDDPVVVSSAFVNNVAVDSSSLVGSETFERTAGAGYHAVAGHILNTPLASLLRSVSPANATIGDIVTYTLEVTMPPGTIMYDATVIDTLPAGMVFDRLVSSTCDMAGSPCDPMITAAEIGVAGSTTAAFFLGDIDVSSSTGEPRTVSVEYEAHVLDSGSSGDTRVSAGSVYGNQVDRIVGSPATPPDPAGFDVVVGPSADTVTLGEPELTVDKDVDGQNGDLDYRRAVPGEVLTYTIRTTNSSAANTTAAYDVVIVDSVPEGLNVTLPIPAGGVWTPDGTPGNGLAGTITWTELGPLSGGATLIHTYQATVEPTLDSGDEVVVAAEEINTVDVPSYFGVSGVDRAANPAFTFREYDDVLTDVVSVELDLASLHSVVWFDVDADGIQEAGEPQFADIDLAVNYLGPDGVISGDDEPHWVTTAADGSVLTDNLPGGTYLVTVDAADLPAGFTPSYDLDDGTLTPDGRWGAGPLGEAEDKTGVDFGYTGTGSVSGTVWFDSDVDGVIGGSEYALEGVELSVTWQGIDGVPSSDDVGY
ncbi:MAG: isopeptide-forming domain-containing fimbrial protein, partial [bacterium]|nr:isopeptide-forming domain-containing fimbrial protein [bacterium]